MAIQVLFVMPNSKYFIEMQNGVVDNESAFADAFFFELQETGYFYFFCICNCMKMKYKFFLLLVLT